MLELNDKNLLVLLERGGGRFVEIDGAKYVRGQGETPFVFINRVREEHNAWSYSQENQKVRAARSVSADNGRGDSEQTRSFNSGIQQVIQGSEASLEEILQSKISVSREQVKKLEDRIARQQRELDNLALELSQQWGDLKTAERWLKELHAGTPENNKKMGGDMVGEVSEGSERGDSVGNTYDTEGVRQGS